MAGDQPGQLGDELRGLLVADAVPRDQRGRRDALGEDLGVVEGIDRVLGAVDDEGRYLDPGEIVDA
jgi:hypothetical protein